MNKKRHSLCVYIVTIIVMLVILSTPVLAKYMMNLEVVSNLPVNIIAKTQADLENAFIAGINDSDIIREIDRSTAFAKYNFTSVSGVYEKLNIPIINLEVGKYYQLYFDVTSHFDISSYYSFGCTVADEPITYISRNDNVNPMINIEHFTWKDTSSNSFSNQCISFFATSETMYWAWDLSACRDATYGSISVKVLDICKTPTPSTQYADFPNAYFLNIENTDYIYASDEAYSQIEGVSNLENSQGTFFTKATYDELFLRMETMKPKYEKIIIPIKNLTVGQQYTLSFDLETTGEINTGHPYGYEIASEVRDDMKADSNAWAKNNENFVNLNGNCTESSTTTFIATTNTMYWVWECSRINDFQWVIIHMTNVTLSTEASTASVFSLREEKDISSDNENILETNSVSELNSETIKEDTATNTIIENQISNSVVYENTINNIDNNQILEETVKENMNNTVIEDNEIVEDDNKENINNTVIEGLVDNTTQTVLENVIIE